MFTRSAVVGAVALTLSTSAHAMHIDDSRDYCRQFIQDCEPETRIGCPKVPLGCDLWLGVPPELGGCPDLDWYRRLGCRFD